ncbi:MAG: tyrosine-protein phosphatase [Acidimicrobiales bacterium]
MSKWGPRSRDGGIDRIPLPIPDGELWLCGKHAIGPDVGAAMLRANGAGTVVCLTERYELADRYPDYVAWLDTNAADSPVHGRAAAIWHPIPDLHAPSLDDAEALVTRIVDRLDDGEGVLMHCAAGIGRAGTMATLVLMAVGLNVTEALWTVGQHRPMAGPEVGAQMDLVEAFSRR